ncbi:MAG: chemotaxis protein CheW [Gammaproteobacteria bacterium]|nr:chemotaxis protein CheW [Gammaproteobacteria bacterium]
MQQALKEVYSLLIPLQGNRIVLPRAAVAEVTGFVKPKDRPDNAPPFLLGFMNWQGQDIPMISYELACGKKAPDMGRRARIAIVFGIDDKLEPNAFAVLTQGYPYLVRVNAGVLHKEELGSEDKQGPVLARVRMANERPLIPDLESLERMLVAALDGKNVKGDAAVEEAGSAEPEDELAALDLGGEDEFEDALLNQDSLGEETMEDIGAALGQDDDSSGDDEETEFGIEMEGIDSELGEDESTDESGAKKKGDEDDEFDIDLDDIEFEGFDDD